jgi:tetratricopeptide (TPR) repeat protein
MIFKDNNTEALVILNKFLESNPKNHDVHLIKGTLCFQAEQFYEAEEIFLKALRIKSSKPFSIYLRLGFMYLKRKSWEDAKLIFAKAIDISSNSSISWLGMGIATLRLGEMAISEECLT